ncbi:MAG: polysaccharide biosynthesis protein [Bacteroidetes bacterium]|nr:polysaccharide biosynthesis protein [Bacteroidota bacterium]
MISRLSGKFNHLFSQSHTPRWIVFLIDLIICFFSISLAHLLRFNFEMPKQYIDTISFVIPYVLFIRAVSFMIFRSYAGLIRYTSAKDTERTVMVVLFGTSILVIGNVAMNKLFLGVNLIPYGIIVIDFLITVFVMSASRLFIKSLYLEINNPASQRKKVIIHGAGHLGVITKQTLDRDEGAKLKVLYFIDNSNCGNKLEGVSICHEKELPEILENNEISRIIITKKDIEPEKREALIDLCLKYDVKVLTIPEASTWINGELSFKQIKEIRIEDLLERPPIKLDEKTIRQQTSGRSILVTGAAGSIGSEIVRQLTKYHPKKIILYDQAESPLYMNELLLQEKFRFYDFEIVLGDIANKERLIRIFEKFKPEIVYHAAAYKHVPMMENNPEEAIRTNVLGTRILADLSVSYGVSKFVMISTDKAVNPTNVMGASKRIAEIYIQSLNKQVKTSFITTRFGNVLGSNGSVIPRFKKQIENGGPVTVTHQEVTRYFMTIPESCQLVLEASVMGRGGEIFIFDMGKSVKIIDLAKKMIRLSGLTLGKDIRLNIIGLRPGEKLYEELLNNKENTIPTYHSKILIAKVQKNDFKGVQKKINELIKFEEKNPFDIVREMKEIVPEFISENSIYEQLDGVSD